jgi:uncharacterized protein YceH (UPF0502 family)
MDLSPDPLTAEEVRVLGCLIEKEATVPDAYPLTLNALRSACNQSSSRNPVVTYDDLTIQRALDSLKAGGWVRFVHPSHGERSTKFRHVADERLALDRPELALLAVLALRGPQTASELRSRTERAHAFGSVGEVESALAAMARREEPLVEQASRGRWVQLLGGAVDADAFGPGPATGSSGSPAAGERLASLEAQVAALTERLARLEAELGL